MAHNLNTDNICSVISSNIPTSFYPAKGELLCKKEGKLEFFECIMSMTNTFKVRNVNNNIQFISRDQLEIVDCYQ